MSALLSQLMRFSQGGEPWRAIPFSLKVKRTAWSVATDGQVMLAIKLPGATARKDYPKVLPDMLADDATNVVVELNLELLKAWAGDPSMSLIPPGEVPYEHHGTLLGQVVDRRKLAHLFAKMTLPKVTAWVAEPGLLAFEPPQKQWRAFLACLKGDPDGGEPAFDPAAVQSQPKSVFELAEELGTE